MGTQTIIFDSVAKEITVLTDMMGQKFAMTQKVENSAEANTSGFDLSNAKIEKTSETKKIAGYTCKKANATIIDEETKESMQVQFWYTEEIDAAMSGLPFKGTLMEYVMNIEGMELQFTITGINKETVASSVFTIPEGYQVMTPEQMQGMIPTMGNE
jgi:GLPGLI family protein